MPLPLIIGAAVAGIVSLLLDGCESQPSDKDPCSNENCSGHGNCLVDSKQNSAYCLCDPEYVNIENRCVSKNMLARRFGDTVGDSSDPTIEKDVEETTKDTFQANEIAAENDIPKPQPEVVSKDTWTPPDVEEPEETSSPETIVPKNENPLCAEQKCISGSAYSCLTKSSASTVSSDIALKTIIIDCSDKETCKDGKCVTKPQYVDPNCGDGWRSSCEVTDMFDIEKETDPEIQVYTCSPHLFQLQPYTNCFTNAEHLDKFAQCPKDDTGIALQGAYNEGDPIGYFTDWVSIKAMIKPFPNANYYRLDIKKDWFTLNMTENLSNQCKTNPIDGWCDPMPQKCIDLTKPVLGILFGDDQSKTLPWDPTWQKCIFQSAGTFTSMGMTNDLATIKFQNMGTNCKKEPTVTSYSFDEFFFSELAISKARVWSCACEPLNP